MPELEIHHINVSQGDSTLLINRDVGKLGRKIDDARKSNSALPNKPGDAQDYLPYAVKHNISLEGTIRSAVLVDAGDDAYGEDIAGYLTQQGVTNTNAGTILTTVTTHYHADHVGGFRDIFYDYDNKKKKLASQTVNLAPKAAYDCGDLNKWDESGTRDTYLSMVEDLVSRGTTQREIFKVHKTFAMGDDADGTAIRLRCIASNGTVAISTNDLTQVINLKKKVDQNARSVVLVVEYGDFRYFLGGDAGGTGVESGGNFGNNKDSRIKSAYSSHPDIESSITAVLPMIYPEDPKRSNSASGHICVHCADHHGSASSNDVFLIEQMQPKVVVCSAGVRRGFHWHPTQEFFQRIDPGNGYSPQWQQPGNTTSALATVGNTVQAYYITEMAQDGSYGRGKANTRYTRTLPQGKILGDVIVRPISAVNPANPSGANRITIQVYGTGLGTDASVATKPLRPYETGTANSDYPIGPFIHDCDKH